MVNTPMDSQKESVPLRATENGDEKMSTVEKTKLIVQFILNHPLLSLYLAQLKSRCNEKDLACGQGIYSDYFFSGKNIHIQNFPQAELGLFESKDFLMSLQEQGLSSDKNKEATEKMRNAMSCLITKIDMDDDSNILLQKAIVQAKQEEKKLVFLMNHMSHLDAPTLDFVFSQILSGEEIERVRFVTGAFMFYNRHVRPFTRAFDTLFVLGPSDFKQMLQDLRAGCANREEKKEITKLLAELKVQSVEEMAKKSEKEACLLFPYAGRASNHTGCKEEIPNGMTDALSREDILYLPIGFIGTQGMMPHNRGGGGDTLKNFSAIVPGPISLRCGQSFSGRQQDMKEIHAQMEDVSSRAYNAWKTLT